MSNYDKWRKDRGDLLEHCAVCGVEGMPERNEKDGDREYTQILYEYSDGACRMDGENLCAECSDWMDSRMRSIEVEASMRYGHARR